MKSLQSDLVESISKHYENSGAIECHVFGSIAENKNDALSDVDIWVTLDDENTSEAIDKRMEAYKKFGEIVLLHEMQNNYPLDGIQTAILYKISDEIVRVDIYLCPKTNSRVLPNSKILFDKVGIEEGAIIPETKRVPRDFSDGVTFVISMCFNTIKYLARDMPGRTEFLLDEFKMKYEDKINKNYEIKPEDSFKTIYLVLDALEENSDNHQINAIKEIRIFAKKIENYI